MDRKYCELSEDDFKNCEKFSYEEFFAFFWQLVEMTRLNQNKTYNFDVARMASKGPNKFIIKLQWYIFSPVYFESILP